MAGHYSPRGERIYDMAKSRFRRLIAMAVVLRIQGPSFVIKYISSAEDFYHIRDILEYSN